MGWFKTKGVQTEVAEMEARESVYNASGTIGCRLEQKKLSRAERRRIEREVERRASTRSSRGIERMQQRRSSAMSDADAWVAETNASYERDAYGNGDRSC